MVRRPKTFIAVAGGCLLAFLATASPAWATQAHGAPEGIYVHQGAHLFFALSMGLLIYWLRSRGMIENRGWRLIQYSALFFILWNLDAFLVHLMDENLEWVSVVPRGHWTWVLSGTTESPILPTLYYFMKMDHLLSVPAMLFLLLGLGRVAQAGAKP